MIRHAISNTKDNYEAVLRAIQLNYRMIFFTNVKLPNFLWKRYKS